MLYAGALIYQQMQHMQKRIDKLPLFPPKKKMLYRNKNKLMVMVFNAN